MSTIDTQTPNQKQGPMDLFVQQRKPARPPPDDNMASVASRQVQPSVKKSNYASSLWEAAVAKSTKKLPQEITGADPSSVLVNVCDEATARQKESEQKQWKVKKPGKDGEEVKLREVYGVIASCAMRFRDVGDLVTQADPVHTALPWLVIRTCLTCAINEHEMYGIMIQGMEMVSGLITHYIVIEQIFVIEDSDHATAVKNSLLSLYTAVLDFLLEALKYFPPVRHEADDKHWFRHKAASGAAKFKRAFQSLDPTSQAAAKGLLDTISRAKANVDADANHAYASKNMQILGEFGKAQDHILKHLESSGFGQEERDWRLSAILAEFHDPLYSIDDKVSSLFDQMDKTQQRAEVTSVLDWLSPATHESRRKTHHKRLSSPKHRLPASGRWLLDHPDYRRWEKSKASSICCLSGIEGTGKTMLLSIVIDHLQTSIFSNADLGRLAFFYASAQEGTLSSKPDDIIRSIVRQLSLTEAGTLEPAVKQKYDDLASIGYESPKPVMYECVDMIVALANEFPIIIVIDGLDELEKGSPGDTMQSSRNDLIKSLKELMERTSNPVKLLFSAFSDGSAEARLRRVFAAPTTDDIDPRGAWHSIEINADKNSQDLGAYVDFELTKRISSADLLEGEVDEKLKAVVKARLLDRSNGMFRYATMQMDRLCDDRMDRTTVLEELDKPLPGITSFYDNSVDEIRNEKIDRVRITAQSTIRWLLCIQEPLLPVNAFLEAVSVEGGIDKPKESNLHSACRRLVKTDHYTGALMFTQPFVREHLVKVPEYGESDCHLAAAERCLRMMINAASSVSRLSATQVRFYWYAKLYWSLHYRNIKFNDATDDSALSEERRKACARVREFARKFLMQGHKTSPAFNKWRAQIPDFVRELGDENTHSKQLKFLQASLEDPLHVICVFGLASVIETQYKNLDFNQPSVHGQTALCLAVENNQLDTVRALLTHGRVDANEFNVQAVHQLQKGQFAPVIYYASALQAAAIQGSIPIIQTLLEHGARTGLVAGYYGSALQAACYAGREETVDFLLAECKADVNSQGGYHGNALQAAAAQGHFRIVEHLLEAGACETASGGHFDSALMAATCARSKEIIECLLAHTADSEFLVNMRSQEYGTPLQRAVDMDRIDIVDLLIANDADINALGGSESKKGSKGSTSALAIAAWSGHNKIVSMLCGLGAAANLSYEPNDFHLLHQAAICNMLDLVEYCLESGVDPNITTDQGPKQHPDQGQMTPLSFACAGGHIQVVHVLLQNGARIEFPEDRTSTLLLAASKGHRDVVETLINKHRNRHAGNGQSTLNLINRRMGGGSGSTALIEAVVATAHDVVSLLLENGARFICKFDGVGPLHVAAWGGKRKIVEILVTHLEASRSQGIDGYINARNKWGKTPLTDAAGKNCIRIFGYLLRHGADCKVKDNDSNSLLHYVAWRNHHEIAEMLLDAWKNEDPKTKADLIAATNSRGNTALQDALVQQHFQTVTLLLAAGARITSSARRHYFYRLSPDTSLQVVKQFIEAFDDHPEELRNFLNHRNRADGYSMLHDAAHHNRPDIAQLILQHGADATTMEDEGGLDPYKVDVKTALHIAVWRGHRKIFDLLLSHALQQCDTDRAKLARFINRQNSAGKTALVDAAERDRPEMMKILLDAPYHADWSLTDDRSYNVLHYCAFRGHRTCVDILLQHAFATTTTSGDDDDADRKKKRFSAFLNQQSAPDLITPLHDVTARGWRDIAMLLLETYGAEYEVYDVHGDSVLHRAVQANQDDLLEPYLKFMSGDQDQGKWKRVLAHRNLSQGRTVREACEVRGRGRWADLVRRYGG
ncbi:MAG: hypothetical protein LQ345_005337 [Seirophora villosa]|nr:MAG: hypothetical protein LQ345_005337 [Seirophora villosa]